MSKLDAGGMGDLFIADAIDRNGAIASPEELFDEIYRGNMVK